jgi:hypothetical protein
VVTRPTVGPVGSPAAPVTPEDLLEYMQQANRSTPTITVEKVAGAVSAALGIVQRACGAIVATDVRVPAWHDGRRGTIVLHGVPAISAVTELATPDGVDVGADLGASAVDWDAGIITLPRGDAGEWVATVTTATTPERTAALQEAVLIIAAHLAAARLAAPGGATPTGYAVPARAEQLMAAWRLPAIA